MILMKLKLLALIIISFLLITYSCKIKKTDGNVTIPQTETNFVWKYGIISEDVFVDKGGRTHNDIKDYYFLTANSEDYINVPKCKGITEKMSDYSFWYVKARVKNFDGLWDTDDPNVQSRVGPYLIFDTIIKIDYPVRIIYSDEKANTYKLNSNSISYTPVPAQNSTGIYNTGEPLIFNINETQFADVFIDAESITSNKSITTEKLQKGCGYITIEFTNSKKQVFIKECQLLNDFEKSLDELFYEND